MITNVWLKSQPNKKISYPECRPIVYKDGSVYIRDKQEADVASYGYIAISRIEFRP